MIFFYIKLGNENKRHLAYISKNIKSTKIVKGTMRKLSNINRVKEVVLI